MTSDMMLVLIICNNASYKEARRGIEKCPFFIISFPAHEGGE